MNRGVTLPDLDALRRSFAKDKEGFAKLDGEDDEKFEKLDDEEFARIEDDESDDG